jgi:PAS domain S-box-containing protein/putative nucleotidyltransferase with HDIG domain
MAENTFRKVVGLSGILGRSRVDRILSTLYRAIKPDYLFVGLIAEDGSHIKTLSLLESGKRIPNIVYPLIHSPCGLIRNDQVKVYRKNAKKYCTEDPYIQNWGIRGFVGLPVRDRNQITVGVLAAFYKTPIEDAPKIIEKMKQHSRKLSAELAKHGQDELQGGTSERFEYLLRNSRDMILIIDQLGKVIYRAPSNYAILGRTDREAVGLNIFEIIHPEDLPMLQKEFKKVGNKPGAMAEVQLRAKHANGEYKWLEGTITNLVKEPSIRGLVINYTDITERKLAGEELTRSERRFRKMIERSQDAITLLSKDYRHLYCSPSITNILGYSSDDWLGLDLRRLVHPDDGDQLRKVFDELRKTPDQTGIYQARMKSRDGRWIWIEAIVTNQLDDPEIGAFVVNFKDISVRKQAEEKLKVTERSFRDFLETVNLAAMILDTEGRVEFINDYLLTLTGHTRQEVIGESFFKRFMEPESSNFDYQKTGALVTRAPQHLEAVIKTNKGTSRLISWSTSLLKDITGDVTGIACIGEDITDFRKNEERVQLQVQRVSALHAIDVVISSSFDARIVFSVIVDQIMKQMGVDAVSIMTYDPVQKQLITVADRGFNFPEKRKTEINLNESHSAMAVLERQTISLTEEQVKDSLTPNVFETEDFVVGYTTPMTIKGQVKGVVEVFNRTPLEPDPGWMEFYETLAGQAAIATENDEMFQRLERALADLTAAYDSTLEGWVKALDLRDKETIGHTQRVAMIVVRFALELGVSGDDLVNIRRGALLHDIGKMGIPDYILNKAGPLTEEERLIIQRHPQYAYELLQPIQYLRPALDIPYAHHERWDGQGYPRGLKGEEIPLAARIFSVVDVWDALGSNRSYRDKWDTERMVAYLEEESGKKFDPNIVKVFIDLYKRKLL